MTSSISFRLLESFIFFIYLGYLFDELYAGHLQIVSLKLNYLYKQLVVESFSRYRKID